MKRLRLGLTILSLCAVTILPAAATLDSDPPKDVEFTYARIRYHMTLDGAFVHEAPWHHDYPYGDEMFPTFLKEVSLTHTSPRSYQIVDIDSPELFKYPFAYISEPGYLDLNSRDVENLRQYIDRGGFLLIDDFRGPYHLSNLIDQMKKVFPHRDFLRLAISHPVFDVFYKVESLDMRPPYGNQPVQFLGMEDDHGRLMMIANYNNDLSEVWQWLDEGRTSLHDAAESLKLGTNYLMYAFTH